MTPTEAVLILVSRGLSEAAVAAAVRSRGGRASQSQVNRIKQGFGCGHALGEVLIGLAQADPPKASALSSASDS